MKMMQLVPIDTFAFQCVVAPFRSLTLEQLVPLMAEADETKRAVLLFDTFESMLAPEKLQEFKELDFEDAQDVILVWMTRS